MAKLAYMQIYPGDELRSPVVGCSIEAQGLWFRMRLILHDSARYGYLEQDRKAIPPERVARMVGLPLELYLSLLADLASACVFAQTPDGILYDQDMADREALRLARAKAGQKGGQRSGLLKQNQSKQPARPQANSDVDADASHRPDSSLPKDELTRILDDELDRVAPLEPKLQTQLAMEQAEAAKAVAYRGSLAADKSRAKVRRHVESVAGSNVASPPPIRRPAPSQCSPPITLPPGIHEVHWIDGLSPAVMKAVEGLAVSFVRMNGLTWEKVRNSVFLVAGEKLWLECAATVAAQIPPGTVSDACTMANSTKSARVIGKSEPIVRKKDVESDPARIRTGVDYDGLAKAKRARQVAGSPSIPGDPPGLGSA